MSPLGSIFQSGCPRRRKFISGYAEGHDMLYKHDSLGGKKADRCESTVIERVAVVLRVPFLLMLYIDTLVCVYLQMKTKLSCPLLTNRIVIVC